MTTFATRRSARPSARASKAAMDREARLVREAIAMVASGASPRVVIAGIRYGETLLDDARRIALEAGVRVNPIWRQDHNGADIVVVPIHE
jgi:hypothetical protein